MGLIETVRTAIVGGAQAVAFGVELLNGQHRNRAQLIMSLCSRPARAAGHDR
jgi:hypothetical protein